ncbi:energy-coupling factor transporter transmembrane component T [Stomatohabitans albus]|uniref:energy-coupling factor transporter transmembrane component T family protein n=1 Tax=Stomatohabitans albus TaxID=3110766 RepID=UPI00300D1122
MTSTNNNVVVAVERNRLGLLMSANPVAKLLAVMVMTTPLIVTIDWLSATVALVLEFPVLVLCGFGLKRVLSRIWPILLAAPLSATSMLLYGQPSGETFWQWGYIHITEGSVGLAIGIFLRIFAIGVPAVVLFIDVDPTEMADGLAQVLKMPAVPVLAALAGFRTAGLMIRDWESLARARRARGLGDRSRLADIASRSFAMLVLALRRGGKLATTMEARGMGARDANGQLLRTWARPSYLKRIDWMLLTWSVIVPTVALGLAAYMGTFRWIVSTSAA